MKTARITSITPDGEFDTSFGHLWAFIVALDDGTEGQANCKKNTPPFRVGDSVGYEVTGTSPQGTTKLKIDRKFGQTAGTAPQVRQAQAPRQQNQQAPVTVGAPDERAFHNTMKKLCLAWCHCFVYAEKVERRLAELGHDIMTPDQKQALVASLWIAARDAGLAQHPPALAVEQPPPTMTPPQPQPIPRSQQQNVAEPVPANGGGDDEHDVPFARYDPGEGF